MPAPKLVELRPVIMCSLTARIVRRGGQGIVDLPDFTQVNFTRRLDEVSTATMTVPFGSPFIASEWRHELLILDERGIVRWAGPISAVADGDEDATISGRDLMAWFDRRFVARDRRFSNDDLAFIFARLAADALAPDPSPNINIVTEPCGVIGDREYLADVLDLAGDKLRELSRTGVDFTCVGRDLMIGGAVTSDRVWSLTGPMCAKIRRSQRGLDQANDVTVIGATLTLGEDTETVVGRSVDSSSAYHLGLLQARFNENEILDVESAKASARTHRELLVEADELHITLKEGEYSFDDLIPGSTVNVDLPAHRFSETTQRGVKGPRRLVSVDCGFSPTGVETSIVLQPIGTEA